MYVGERNVRETRRLQAYSFLVRLMYIVHTHSNVQKCSQYMQRYEISKLKRGIRSSTEQANKSIRFALIQKTSMTFSRINSPFLFLLPFTSSSLQFLLWLVVIVCKAKQLLKKCVRTSAFLVHCCRQFYLHILLHLHLTWERHSSN